MVGARHTLMAIRALQTPKKKEKKGYCVRLAPHSLLLPNKCALLFTAVALNIKIHKLLHWSPFHCQVSERAVQIRCKLFDQEILPHSGFHMINA